MFLLRPQHRDAHRAAQRDSALGRERLDGREWKYVAEGGANVLFRHHPPTREAATKTTDVPAFYGKLLRVKKCDAAEDATRRMRKKRSSRARSSRSVVARSSSVGSVGSDAEDAAVVLPAEPYNAHYPHPTQVVEYATKDILPFLEQQVDGNVYEQVAQLLAVDQRFLMELNEQLLSLETRPEHRRQSQIDVALQCVMVLPDVTLPPPDEDPLVCFDETIDSEEGSESGASTIKEASEEESGDVESGTDQATDEDLFDSLVDDLDAVLDESIRTPRTNKSNLSASAASTVTADAEFDDEVDDDDDEEDIDIPPVPRRRRMLSGNCNIFDCCFRNICVEIKPKIGFKPRGELIADVRKRVCRFCMHQHYKRATGKVEEISEYCPLDLFSRDADRIRRALRALQRTPQNNFKVFVRSNNDEVVNVITGLGADALPKGVAQTKYSCKRKRMGFRHSCQSIGTESELHLQDEADRLLPDVVELLTEVLLKLEILEDLKKIQLLDHVSVDGMWHLHKLVGRLQEVANGNKDELLSSLVEVLRTNSPLKEEDEFAEGSLARCLAFLEVAMREVPEMDVLQGIAVWQDLSLASFEAFYEQLVRRFQVATTLKDCSLLLCLRRDVEDMAPLPVQNHHPQCLTKASPRLVPATGPQRKPFDHLREYEHRIAFRDMAFNCVVAIVDLDVKSHKSVDDYYRLDDKIVQHYVRTFGDKLPTDVCRED